MREVSGRESPRGKLLVEVIYKADYCLPCYYMDEGVREVLPRFGDRVEYRRVCFMETEEDERRFLELSASLYGKAAVEELTRVAPVPSLFIEGRLAFDMIPPRFELEEAIVKALAAKGLGEGGGEGMRRIYLEVLHEGEH